jgi:hypothetical protein
MNPMTLEEALKAGWIEMTPQQVEEQRALHPPDAATILRAPVDCNFAPEGTRCGGFGPHIVCFCTGGLCKCFHAPGAL